MDFKPLPIGIENFEDMIVNDYYYIDKTLLIKELIEKKGKVNLFTRPRRFGKSLNISMLQCYFEKTEVDNLQIFDGLNIMSAGEKYTSERNQYPVIKLTLKSAGQPNYELALMKLKEELIREFDRHRYLLQSDKITEEKKEAYKKLLYKTAEIGAYSGSLKFLTQCLEQHHDKKVIVLIDEYDVPLETSYFKGYYEEMVDFIRSLFESALKTNDSLDFAVMTGCLRISKESIFTGLNNLNILSITSNVYGEYFGFTEAEVGGMLSHYHLEDRSREVREWYNGYLFGETNVYNPWSVIKYMFDMGIGKQKYPIAHWANTSSNSIIRDLIAIADDVTREEVEALIKGESIEKPIHEDIVYSEVKQNMDNLWNFLFFTGYLKKVSETVKDKYLYYTLKIPNKEVEYIYERQIREWFDEKTKIADTGILLTAIREKDEETLSEELNKRLSDIISYYDSQEAFYHGFLLGILSNIQGYTIKSNRETGNGRSDIYMKDKGIHKRAIIFELKMVGDRDDPEEKCEEALTQIETKKYAYDLTEEGYRNVLMYGIAFRGKECMVRAR